MRTAGEERRAGIALAAEFRRGEFQILLASEVAGEGLDFEHCHVVINYDLPWNPMRVEQRIGRCDRIGQTSDKGPRSQSGQAKARSSRGSCPGSTRGLAYSNVPWEIWR